MPDFTHDGHVYYNPLEFAMAHIGGTWKSPILYRLKKAFDAAGIEIPYPHLTVYAGQDKTGKAPELPIRLVREAG